MSFWTSWKDFAWVVDARSEYEIEGWDVVIVYPFGASREE